MKTRAVLTGITAFVVLLLLGASLASLTGAFGYSLLELLIVVVLAVLIAVITYNRQARASVARS